MIHQLDSIAQRILEKIYMREDLLVGSVADGIHWL